MTAIVFQTTDDLKGFTLYKSEKELKNQLGQLTIVEISRVFLILQSQSSKESIRKAEIVFEYIFKNNLLEALGKILSVPSYLALLDFLSPHTAYHKYLSPILAGLQPHIFFQSIYFCDENQLSLLKHESLFEPLQYQLTQFIHEGNKLLNQIDQEIEKLKSDIRDIQHNDLDKNSLYLLEEKILSVKEKILESCECISKILTVAWNTDRLDLIDKISILNEAFHHQLYDYIGHPSQEGVLASGIFDYLEKILFSIYENSFLSDQDAATEGLTRLGIWYLADYWKLGMFPNIKKVDDLDLDHNQYEEQTRWHHHQKLFSKVQNQLKQLGLLTVEDLKKNNIYSKQLLVDYIEKNKEKLISSENVQ